MNARFARFLFLVSTLWAGVDALADNAPFMMISGISAADEMCVTAVAGVEVVLEPCSSAVAAGDSRELWQRLPKGQLASVASEKCLSTQDNVVSLAACDAADEWEAQGNGQLKLGHAGNLCLSQQGLAAGVENAALHSAIAASSAADEAAHGANVAADGSLNTFWASAMDPTGPVSISIDFGSQRKLTAINIDWEFPAKSFSVSVSTDGVQWEEVHATDSNVLSSTSIPLGKLSASMVRLLMHEAASAFHGHSIYGIKEISAHALRLQSVAEECTTAAKSVDARDKYFATYVGEFAPCSSKELRSELPALAAAQASVEAAAAELAEVLPKLSSCHGAALMRSDFNKLALSSLSNRYEKLGTASTSKLGQHVDEQNGFDKSAVAALLQEARRIIIAARSALF